MPWSDVEDCLDRAADRLAEMTNVPNRLVNLGLADGVQTVWDTPFYNSSAVSGYINRVLEPATVVEFGGGTDDVDLLTFTVAPTAGARVSCASPDGVNLRELDKHLYSAQQAIRSKFNAAVPDVAVVPTDDATTASELLKTAAFEIASFTLSTRLALQPLRWPMLEQRYYWLLGGGPEKEKGELNKIAQGSIFDMLLPAPSSALAAEGVSWDSEPSRFGDPDDDTPTSWPGSFSA